MRALPKVSEAATDPFNSEKNLTHSSTLQLSVRANAGLTIAYTIPHPANVSVSINTLNGSRVASFDKKRQFAGSYHCNWNYGNASGLYVVCLKMDNLILSRTVMLTP
jgi:hypothetical protein